jgi:alginate O-acetyltransferase complex protein AlgI
MLFSSPPFFLFFAIYFLVHLAVPPRLRLALIIVGSTIFYGYWNLYYIWIPHFLMLLAYFGALWTDAASDDRTRSRRMGFSVIALLSPLAFVKYSNFIYSDVLGPVLGFSGKISDFALPLGISFVSFTMVAYVVDVYRRRFKAERRVSMLAGLVLFFPHLIAGPILRPHDLLPQLARPQSMTRALRARIVFGLAIFSIGLLKKLVFADPMGEAVDAVFSAPGNRSAAEYLLAIYGFALQIYCDFSGYTDMAIGVALAIGVRLPTNFLHPYTSASIVEFWRRWHITLSTWLRDYLYIPLGGNRIGYRRQLLNIMVTMGLGGLWHGANWTFVFWGLLHGIGIAISHALRHFSLDRFVQRVPRWMLVLVTFHFVLIAWIPFRAPNMATVWTVLSGPFTAPLGDIAAFLSAHLFQLLVLAVFFALHRWDSHRQIRRLASRIPGPVLWPTIILIWVLAITVSAGSSAKFIYFDF